MKIEQYKDDRRFGSYGCETETSKGGNSYFMGNYSKCKRKPVFVVDDVKLCRQHAGDAALCYLLKASPN